MYWKSVLRNRCRSRRTTTTERCVGFLAAFPSFRPSAARARIQIAFAPTYCLACKKRLDSRFRGNDEACPFMCLLGIFWYLTTASGAYLKTTIPNRSGL